MPEYGAGWCRNRLPQICPMEKSFEKQKSKSIIKKHKAKKVKVKRAKNPVKKIDPCSICGERVKTNAIECTACKAWVHKDVQEFVMP